MTVISSVNNDEKSRFIIFINSEDYDERILEVINRNIPIFTGFVENKPKVLDVASPFSRWFRATMGSAFILIDIDYFFVNKLFSKIIVIEEKQKESALQLNNYGQKLSYKELLRDVLKETLRQTF